jgi:hypothetical protein
MLREGPVDRVRNALVRRTKKPLWHAVHGLTGARLQMQVRFLDMGLVGAHFAAPTANVQKLLPSQRLLPIERSPGTAEIFMAGMEYRHVDILFPYNEFGIMVPATYHAEEHAPGEPGYLYRHLPVTTEDARWTGVENYGFPKFLADISFEETADLQRCRLEVEGREILTLEVTKGATEPQSWEIHNYTVREGALVTSLFQAQGPNHTSGAPGGARCALGDHPLAEELRALGMELTSVRHQYAPQVQATLSKAGSALPI